jgi:hypothetical protein
MVCGQLVQKDDFFIDTNDLDMDSTRAADLMHIDSNVEDESNLFFPKIKQSSNAIDS